MVLSDDALWAIIDAVPGCEELGDGGAWLVRVLRAVEAEVHKQDTALIRQLLNALRIDRIDTEDWPADSRIAIDALRARLEGKP